MFMAHSLKILNMISRWHLICFSSTYLFSVLHMPHDNVKLVGVQKAWSFNKFRSHFKKKAQGEQLWKHYFSITSYIFPFLKFSCWMTKVLASMDKQVSCLQTNCNSRNCEATVESWPTNSRYVACWSSKINQHIINEATGESITDFSA